MRSPKTKKAFIKYLKEHPEERFWQALRNFSGFHFIYGCNDFVYQMPKSIKLVDTFYEEENFKEADHG